MAPSNSWLPRPELQALRRGLAQAQDAQIIQVVAMVDALGERGATDDVIADVRPRLAQLRPSRPMRFDRLLFLPLDPLIVPRADWQAGSATIPRTALAPVAEAVRRAMGADAGAIDVMIGGHTTRDTATVAKAGSLLWEAAARNLANAPRPESWTKAGLPAETYPTLARQVAALCGQEATLQALLAEADIGVTLIAEKLCPILRGIGCHDTIALTMIVALLFARLPQSRALLADAARMLGQAFDDAMRGATEAALELLLARLEAAGGTEALVVASRLAEAGAQVRQIAAMLIGTDIQTRIRTAILRRLDASCRTRFAAGLDEEFVKPLQRFSDQRDTTGMLRLEEAARALKELMCEARLIGSSEIYDGLLRQTIAAVKAIRPGGALSLVDKVRLVEILAGSGEALTMLELPAVG
jgi:hypothetical protein